MSHVPERRRPPVPPALRASFVGERVLAVLAVLATVGVVFNVVTLDALDALRGLIFVALFGGGYWMLRKVNSGAREEYRRRGY